MNKRVGFGFLAVILVMAGIGAASVEDYSVCYLSQKWLDNGSVSVEYRVIVNLTDKQDVSVFLDGVEAKGEQQVNDLRYFKCKEEVRPEKLDYSGMHHLTVYYNESGLPVAAANDVTFLSDSGNLVFSGVHKERRPVEGSGFFGFFQKYNTSIVITLKNDGTGIFFGKSYADIGGEIFDYDLPLGEMKLMPGETRELTWEKIENPDDETFDTSCDLSQTYKYTDYNWCR
jgi:hypothetical protein